MRTTESPQTSRKLCAVRPDVQPPQKCDYGAWLNNENQIIMSLGGRDVPVMNAADIKIPGSHNIENYLAAVSALWGYVEPEVMVRIAKTFGGWSTAANLYGNWTGCVIIMIRSEQLRAERPMGCFRCLIKN